MAGITLAQAQTQLDLWVAADTAVASGQAYSIQGRSFTKVDAGEISKKIDYWARMVTQLTNSTTGGARVRYGMPTL
jgi:hypothetical protein